MAKIQVLDQLTIDKIAAGEVIERPASIVKELVENAIDAGATAVTVEIADGGISLIRISDNGCGIAGEDVPTAFLRHSTSKIQSAEDLSGIGTLGFRGEALSSIAAVAQVELRTKQKDSDTGVRYVIEGGAEKVREDIGMPDGTSFFVRQIFFNTPARRKFLKTPMTEASHVSDLVTRLALSHPEISFRLIVNKQPKLHTSGNGKLKDVIYQVFGRDIAANLLEVDVRGAGIAITGYIGKPLVSRGNRNYENYYINGRYVKSTIVARAIEDAYKGFTMQHKYPFTVLHFQMDGKEIDVNVHPTKMELRFGRQQDVYHLIYTQLREVLNGRELIPRVTFPEKREAEKERTDSPARQLPENGSADGKADASLKDGNARTKLPEKEEEKLDYFMKKMRERVSAYHNRQSSAEVKDRSGLYEKASSAERVREAAAYRASKKEPKVSPEKLTEEAAPKKEEVRQMELFEEKLLSEEARKEHTLVGQVFDTYWIVEYRDQLYIIDQHAAHERVLYERTLEGLKKKEFTSQYLSPPMILSLSMSEEELLREHLAEFEKIGFEMEPFGGGEYAVRAVPDNLFGIAKKELLIEMLDNLSDSLSPETAPDIILEKIASMSCKAAVKGNARLAQAEADALIGELLTLENPYHCPHGRPTIIAMTKRELEKKFKRIL